MKGGKTMFYQNLIDLNISVKTEEELFDLVGSRLIKLDFANLGYIANLEKREISYPTGLKFSNISLALPHVDPQYVKQPFIYIARTTENLVLKQMGDCSEMTAQNFLFLGLKNGEKQPELLAQIMSAFQNTEFVNNYKNANTVNSILELTKKQFRRF